MEHVENSKFARLGMDSAMSVFFLLELENWLGMELSSDLVFEFPSIAELARHLVASYPAKSAPPGG